MSDGAGQAPERGAWQPAAPGPAPNAPDGPEQPTWYTPGRLLAFFCTVVLVTWTDLGIFASNYLTGDDDDNKPLGVKKEFGLNGVQIGLLPALYNVGLFVFSFVFSELVKDFNAFRLVGCGMLIWAAGLFISAFAQSYAMLVIGRMIVGAGAVRRGLGAGWLQRGTGCHNNKRLDQRAGRPYKIRISWSVAELG